MFFHPFLSTRFLFHDQKHRTPPRHFAVKSLLPIVVANHFNVLPMNFTLPSPPSSFGSSVLSGNDSTELIGQTNLRFQNHRLIVFHSKSNVAFLHFAKNSKTTAFLANTVPMPSSERWNNWVAFIPFPVRRSTEFWNAMECSMVAKDGDINLHQRVGICLTLLKDEQNSINSISLKIYVWKADGFFMFSTAFRCLADL